MPGNTAIASATRNVRYLIPGPPGERVVMRGPQLWVKCPVGFSFMSGATGEQYIDIVIYDGLYYSCNTSHVKTETNFPGSSDDRTLGLWEQATSFDIVATRLMLAEQIKANQIDVGDLSVEHLRTNPESAGNCVSIQDNYMTVHDGDGNMRVKITSEALTSSSASTQSVTLPYRDLIDATLTLTANNRKTERSSAVTFTLTENGTLTIPAMTGSKRLEWELTKRGYTPSSGQEISVYAYAYWELDGSRIGPRTQSIVTLGSDSVYQGYMNLPEVSVPVNGTIAGITHSLKLAVDFVAYVNPISISSKAEMTFSFAGQGTAAVNFQLGRITELGSNGLKVSFATDKYLEAVITNNQASFTIQCGNYGLKVSDNGIEKWDSSTSQWVPASL